MKVGGGGGLALRILRATIFAFNFAGGPDGFNFTRGERVDVLEAGRREAGS